MSNVPRSTRRPTWRKLLETLRPSLSGGRGRAFSALVGALLISSLNNGVSLMNVPTFYQDTARCVVLLLAVTLDHQQAAIRRPLTRQSPNPGNQNRLADGVKTTG